MPAMLRLTLIKWIQGWIKQWSSNSMTSQIHCYILLVCNCNTWGETEIWTRTTLLLYQLYAILLVCNCNTWGETENWTRTLLLQHIQVFTVPQNWAHMDFDIPKIFTPVSVDFTNIIPIQRARGTIKCITSPELSVLWDYYGIVIYIQSTDQKWRGKPGDYQQERSLKNYQKSVQIR